jgi:hypothetical protein
MQTTNTLSQPVIVNEGIKANLIRDLDTANFFNASIEVKREYVHYLALQYLLLDEDIKASVSAFLRG